MAGVMLPDLRGVVQPVLRSVFDPSMRAGAPYAPDIGEAGQLGFGLGVAPPAAAQAGYTPMPGHDDPASPNYGNYQYTDGSVMCWVPAFFYRIGSIESPRFVDYGANAVDISRWGDFPSAGAANAAGYALHRAFYDGGEVKAGFFVDKYMCSNNSGVASSIQNGPPLSTHSTHNPLSGLNGSPEDRYYGTVDAAKTRGPQFFPAMRYMHAALALLSLAHGQAATSDDACAWYDPSGATNFPKGNNNNNFGDTNDSELTFVHDGFAGGNSALTGSGVPYAKTTHNGQDSGVTDLNGNMYDMSLGLTVETGSTGTITAATQTSPVVLTVPGHGMTAGQQLRISGATGMGELNNRIWSANIIDEDTLELVGTDGTEWSEYEGDGSAVFGQWYALKTSARAADLTSGQTESTDAWGPAGVAANYDPIGPGFFRTDYPNNNRIIRFGNGDEQVLSSDVNGEGWALAGMGLPLPSGATSGGDSLFGNDYYYNWFPNRLAPLAGMAWSNGTLAGVWALNLFFTRSNTGTSVGFRAASYLNGPAA